MNSQLIVSPLALLLALALVVIALVINLKEDLGMTKDLIVGVLRAVIQLTVVGFVLTYICLLYTSPSPRDPKTSRMPSSA